MKTKNLLKKGFTLTEMLIVILIIALLMAFIIPQLLKGPAAARDATRVNRVNEIAAALEAYRTSKGSYPTAAYPICLAGDNPTDLKSFISETALKDPDANNKFDACASLGGFVYKSLSLNGIDNNAFVVLTKLEAEGKGNIGDKASTSIIDNSAIEIGKGRTYAKFSY